MGNERRAIHLEGRFDLVSWAAMAGDFGFGAEFKPAKGLPLTRSSLVPQRVPC